MWARTGSIGKPLGAQQLLGNILRSSADAGEVGKADRGCFEGTLRGERSLRSDETGGTASDSAVRKRRRVCIIGIRVSCPLALTPSARV